MRLAFAFAVLAAAAMPAFAADSAQQGTMKTCATRWKSVSDMDKKKTKYTDYMATCMKGPAPGNAMKAEARPAAMNAEAKPAAMKMADHAGGGQAKCKDGKTVTYKRRSGTCSGHGGVAAWM